MTRDIPTIRPCQAQLAVCKICNSLRWTQHWDWACRARVCEECVPFLNAAEVALDEAGMEMPDRKVEGL